MLDQYNMLCFKASDILNISEKAQAGNVTQNIHPPVKQSTFIHIQTHPYHRKSALIVN